MKKLLLIALVLGFFSGVKTVAQSTYTLNFGATASVFDPNQNFSLEFVGILPGSGGANGIFVVDDSGTYPFSQPLPGSIFEAYGVNQANNDYFGTPVQANGTSITFTVPSSLTVQNIEVNDTSGNNEENIDMSQFSSGTYNISEGSDSEIDVVQVVPEASTNAFFLFSAFLCLLTRTKFGKPWFRLLKMVSRGLSRQWRSCSSSSGFGVWSNASGIPTAIFVQNAMRRCAASTGNFERVKSSRPFAFGPTIGPMT